jgi:hypothetical protein
MTASQTDETPTFEPSARGAVIGTDAEGMTHCFDAIENTLQVVREDEPEPIYTRDLPPEELSEWVDHIENVRGWDTLRYETRSTAAFIADALGAA